MRKWKEDSKYGEEYKWKRYNDDNENIQNQPYTGAIGDDCNATKISDIINRRDQDFQSSTSYRYIARKLGICGHIVIRQCIRYLNLEIDVRVSTQNGPASHRRLSESHEIARRKEIGHTTE